MEPLIAKTDAYRRSLRFRLIAATVLVELIMLALLVGNSLRLADIHLTRLAEGRLQELEETFSISMAAPLAARDHATLRGLAERLVQLQDIAYLVVLDPAGTQLAREGAVPSPLPPPDAHVAGNGAIHNARITVDLFGQTLGTLHYGLSTAFLVRAKQDLLNQGLMISGAEVLLSTVALSTIAILLTRRLETLTTASVRMAAGDYRALVSVGGNDEIAALSRAFNAMALAVRRHVDELERNAEVLKSSNEELARLAEVTAHHLQEPLRHVASYAQLLSSRYHGRLDPEADDFIRYMVDGVQRMKSMLVDLQTYIAVDLSPLPDSARADLDACVAEARHALGGAIAASGAAIEVAPLPTVLGDKAQLTQVFEQLIANAIAHAEPGRSPKVAVRAEAVDGRVMICVSDDGPGIAEEDRARVFDLFRSLAPQGQGSGVGLPIVKKVVRRHGGHVWVQPTGARGACLCFTLRAHAGPEAEA